MAEKPVQSLDFRQLNPMDVSLPTVSPKFGEEVGKAMSQFGQIVQKGVLDYARTAKKIEDEQEIYGIRKEYLKASADKIGEYTNTQSGGKINGQLLSSDYQKWSEDWLKNRTGGLSRDLQLKVSRELESKMGNDYARLVPMQNKYATEKFLTDNVKRTEALGNTLLSLNPEIAYDEVDVMIQQNEQIMEDAAGNIINPDQAAEEMIKFNNTVAVNSLENFVNNRRPDLIVKALGPYLQSEEAQNMLEANGISPEELGVDASQPTTIDANITPKQKSQYIRKAFQIMKELDQEDRSILQNRINNYMNAHQVGQISDAQSLSEFVSIEKEILSKDSFGKDKFPPDMAANTLLKMTGAHVNKVVTDRIPRTPNGMLASGLGHIKRITQNNLNELKERYADNPEIREYLETPTIIDSMLKNAYSKYQQAATQAAKERSKDSALYLQKNDSTIAAATEGLLQEVGAAGAPNPSRLSEYINVVRSKADNLNIPRDEQTMLPEPVVQKLADTALALRDKYSPTGMQYAAYLEELKSGVPPEDWMDFKEDLKEKGLKDADFYTVDNFNPKVAGYWQKLNNPEVIEGLKVTAQSDPNLSATSITKQLTDRGWSAFGLTSLIGEEAISEGPLATTSPIGKALIGPGGEIRNKIMHDRITEMAVNSVRWEVGQGKDLDDALEEAEKRIEEAFPTVQGKYGTVIVSGLEGMENPEYAKNTVKDFLDYDHRASDYTANFVNHPSIQAQLKGMDLTDPVEQAEYLDDNYEIEFANIDEGRMSAYLKNKNDNTTIPLEINDVNGRPVPLEVRLNPDEIQSRLGDLRRMREIDDALDGRDPSSPMRMVRMGGNIEQAPVSGESPAERLDSVVDSILDGNFANYDSEYAYDIKSNRYTSRRMRFVERGKTKAQQESKRRLLGLSEENKAEFLRLVQDRKHPAHRLAKRILNRKLEPTPTERIQFKNALLFEIGQIEGNIPEDIKERINQGFKWTIGSDLNMYVSGRRNNSPLLMPSKRNGWNNMMKSFPRQHKGFVSDEMVRVTLDTESLSGKNRYDSSDNLSAGPLQIAHHQNAAIADVIEGQSAAHFKKYFPLYATDLQGMDKTVSANNDKLSLAIMYSYYNGSIFPTLDKHYPNKKWKKGEKELYAMMMYNSGPNKKNFEANFLQKSADNDQRFVKARKALMGNTNYRPYFGKGRAPKSESEPEVFNEPTQTADWEKIISDAMDKLNDRIHEIFKRDK